MPGNSERALVTGRENANRAREALLFAASLILVAVVATAIAGSTFVLLLAIVLSAGAAAVLLQLLFPGRAFFSLTFTNLVAVYAAIFAFFMEELFGLIGPTISGLGFCLPILAFLLGCWLQQADIRIVVNALRLRDEQALYGALVWLVPVAIVGAGVFLLSRFAEALVNTNQAFLLSMLVISLIVFAVSRNVAIFLVDAGLLFDEFLQRMSRLAVPAFAFLTFYALLVILFASIFSIISHYAGSDHFRVGNVARAISFSEAIHFSIVTISTVGYGDIVPASNIARMIASVEVMCGVMLLLFGVSELLEYTREHQRRKS